eukprot:4061476-Alexandrium_andersonii.AAC.1
MQSDTWRHRGVPTRSRSTKLLTCLHAQSCWSLPRSVLADNIASYRRDAVEAAEGKRIACAR